MSLPRVAYGATVAVTLAGQVCAVSYEIAVAGHFGTTRDADMLALTLTLVLAVGNEFVTWVSALFIPHYVEAETREGAAPARRFLRAAFATVAVGAGAVGVLLVAAADPLLALLAPHLADTGAPGLLRLVSPLVLLLPLGVLLAGALQVRGWFVLASARQVFWYGSAILALAALGPGLGVAAVGAGMVAGLAVFCGLLALVQGRLTWAPLTMADPASPRLGRAGRALLPLAAGSAVNYVNVLTERSLAARLPEGSLAALTYAFRLLNFPITLFILNATAMIFPLLAAHAAREDRSELERLVRRALRLALAFSVPLAALAAALAEPAVRILLERGTFTAESTRLTSTAIAWYAPGLVGIAAGQVVLSRVYQALHDVRRMVQIGVIVIAVNILLMVSLTPSLGLRALPLAASSAALVLLCLMVGDLRRHLPGLALAQLAGTAMRIAAAGVAAFVCAVIVYGWGWPSDVAGLLVAGTAGVAAYAVVLVALSREDVRLALTLLPAGMARRLGLG